MSYVVEMTGYNPAVSAVASLAFAIGPGLAPTDHAYIESGLVSWASPSQKVDIGTEGGVQLSADAGKIVIQNARDSFDIAGPHDDMVNWSWQTAALYWVDTTWAGRQLLDQGVLQQPVSDLAQATMTFPLRDPRWALNIPLQSTKYAGSGGVEGGADLKGKPKPILYGVVSNIPGILIDQTLLIFQLADKPASVLCARDGGVSLTVSTARGSLASMQATAPPPGHYDTYAGTEGTFVRLCSKPVFAMAFDAQEGATEPDRTHAQIWSRIRTERCGNVSGDIEAASVTATDTLDGHEVGFWWADETTRLDAVNAVLTSLSGYEVLTFTPQWRIAKLVAPSGTTVFDLLQMTNQSALTTKSRPLATLGFARPTYAPDGAPPFRINVRWGKNYRVMALADFAGAAPLRLQQKFADEYRVETAINTAIWNPATLAGPWPNAPELTISTGYQPGVDGLTCPHAATEASRLLTLYAGLKGQYQTSFPAKPTDRILIGDVVSITYPQMGLGAGPLFKVLQAAYTVNSAQAMIALVLGLQT